MADSTEPFRILRDLLATQHASGDEVGPLVGSIERLAETLPNDDAVASYRQLGDLLVEGGFAVPGARILFRKEIPRLAGPEAADRIRFGTALVLADSAVPVDFLLPVLAGEHTDDVLAAMRAWVGHHADPAVAWGRWYLVLEELLDPCAANDGSPSVLARCLVAFLEERLDHSYEVDAASPLVDQACLLFLWKRLILLDAVQGRSEEISALLSRYLGLLLSAGLFERLVEGSADNWANLLLDELLVCPDVGGAEDARYRCCLRLTWRSWDAEKSRVATFRASRLLAFREGELSTDWHRRQLRDVVREGSWPAAEALLDAS